MTYRRSNDRRRLRGNVALLTALMITMLVAFVALSFDVGNLYRVRTETQSGLDAAALAGASRLGTAQAANAPGRLPRRTRTSITPTVAT